MVNERYTDGGRAGIDGIEVPAGLARARARRTFSRGIFRKLAAFIPQAAGACSTAEDRSIVIIFSFQVVTLLVISRQKALQIR